MRNQPDDPTECAPAPWYDRSRPGRFHPKTDVSLPFQGNRQVRFGYAKANDKCAVVGEHRLIPRNFGISFGNFSATHRKTSSVRARCCGLSIFAKNLQNLHVVSSFYKRRQPCGNNAKLISIHDFFCYAWIPLSLRLVHSIANIQKHPFNILLGHILTLQVRSNRFHHGLRPATKYLPRPLCWAMNWSISRSKSVLESR